MNRFSDGFSDNSYDSLLDEYAGESLGARSSKQNDKPAVQKKSTPVNQRPAPQKKPEFDIDISSRKVEKKSQLDIELIKPFEDNQPVKSDTMEFSKKTMPVRKDNARKPIAKSNKSKGIDLSAIKSFIASKIPAKKEAVTEQDNANYYNNSKEKPKVIYKQNGKIKFDFAVLIGLIIKTIRNNQKECIIFGCCILLSIAISAIALSCVNDVLAINRQDSEAVEVVLPNEADTSVALKVLDKAGLIKNRIFCSLFLNLMGESDEGYLPGVYYLTADLGVEKMIDRFKTSSKRGAMISVTIPEGYTLDQIFERLEKNDICTAESLYQTVEAVDFGAEYDFIAKLDNVEERYQVLEGYMFPATYEFEQGADPGSVIRKFLDAFKSRWTEEYAARAAELGMSVDDIIRLASIVEKEGANKEQFTLVSSVLHNRLNRSGIYPLLQCDSTKDYVENTIAKRVNSTAKISSYIIKYNTYDPKCIGLPVSSICNPGPDAIEAALYPDTTNYYFFRHDKNGKIYMAEKPEEHAANGRLVEKVNAED